MLIEIFYSEQNTLHVLVRTLKLASTTSVDQSSGKVFAGTPERGAQGASAPPALC